MSEAFQGIQVPERQNKPRSRGTTMMIDWGIPLGQQADILAAYREAGISTANGGLLTELALKQGTYDAMLAELIELGFDAVEVSENLISLTAAEKTEAVTRAYDMGLGSWEKWDGKKVR